MAGLLARAVVVIGADGNVAYEELVPEIAQEPELRRGTGGIERGVLTCDGAYLVSAG